MFNRSLTFYAVLDKLANKVITDIPANTPIYTITASIEDATEFIYRWHIVNTKKGSHFLGWCDRNDRDHDAISSFIEYSNLLELNPTQYYSIVPIKIDKRNIAAHIRLSTGCTPIGCNFESQAESAKLVELLSKKFDTATANKSNE